MKGKLRLHKLINLYGKKVTVQDIKQPPDHPKVKRYRLNHPYAKAFYLSTSTGSVNNSPAFSLERLYVADYGHKISAVSREEVSHWLPNLSAEPV